MNKVRRAYSELKPGKERKKVVFAAVVMLGVLLLLLSSLITELGFFGALGALAVVLFVFGIMWAIHVLLDAFL